MAENIGNLLPQILSMKWNLAQNNSTPNPKATELEAWQIFHCLARSALVLEHGSESEDKPRWNREIVHFDIKQENGKNIDLTSA